MAVTNISLVPIELNGMTYSGSDVTALAFSTGTTADGFAVDYTKADNKIVILFNAAAAGTATVKAGDLIQGTVDITLTVPQGISCAVLDSGYFKKSSGKVVVIPSATNIGCAAIVLP